MQLNILFNRFFTHNGVVVSLHFLAEVRFLLNHAHCCEHESTIALPEGGENDIVSCLVRCYIIHIESCPLRDHYRLLRAINFTQGRDKIPRRVEVTVDLFEPT